jgi:hypothetical protein
MPLNLGLDRDTLLRVVDHLLGCEMATRFGRPTQPMIAVTLTKKSEKVRRLVDGKTLTQCCWLNGKGWSLSFVRRNHNGRYTIDWNYNLMGDEEAFNADWLMLTLALR